MTDHITFTAFSKLSEEDRAPHAERFAKLNETPVLQDDLKSHYHKVGFVMCEDCGGQGYYEHDTGNPHTYRAHAECPECHGSGEIKMSYQDFIDMMESN